MKEHLTKEQAMAILKSLDETIDAGPWDKTNFLRVIGKNLRDIRADFVAFMEQSNLPSGHTEKEARRMALRSGLQKIFIGLYTADGENLSAWERILANLPKHIISRPIYSEEKDIQASIKTKENKKNEGYVSIFIDQNDILEMAENKKPVDKLGKTLLSLKNHAIHIDNIHSFVHVSGVYHYENGRLIKQSEAEQAT